MTWRYDESQNDNATFLRQFIAFLQSCIEQRAAANPDRPEFVPSRVRVTRCIRADIPWQSPSVLESAEYSVTSNQWGAIAATATNGKLMGIKPAECIVLEMCPNPHLKRNQGEQ